MSFRRAGTAVLALLAVGLFTSACYRSTTSLTPDAVLTDVEELSPGRYCAAAPDRGGEIVVDLGDCRVFAFDAGRRVYAEIRSFEGARWSIEHRVARLGDAFYMTQATEDGHDRFPFVIVPFVASRDGFAAIGDVGGDGFGIFARAFPDIAVAEHDRFSSGFLATNDSERARTLIELAARSDASAWIAGEGDPEAVVVYVRLGEEETAETAAERYESTLAAVRARGVRLRR
jgi:hypothetical protein